MRNVELRIAKLTLTVGVARIVVLPVRISNRTCTIVHTLRVSKGVACCEVKAEVESLFKECTEGVAVTAVGILQIDDAVVVRFFTVVVRSSRVLFARHSIGLCHLIDGEVLEEDVVHRLAIDGLERHLHVARQRVFKSEVRAENLWVLKLLAHHSNVGFLARSAGVGHIVENLLVVVHTGHALRDGGRFHFYTITIEGIAEPYERHTTGEDTRTAAQERLVIRSEVPVEAETRANHEFRTRNDTYLSIQILALGVLVESFVSCWFVENSRQIDTQTISHIEVGSSVPFVLSIEAKLACLDGWRILRVTASERWVGVLIVESVGLIVEEIVQVIESPRTISSLNEEVRNLVDFVVCTESQRMATQVPAEVILQRVDVLVQRIGCRTIFCTDIERDAG